MRNRDVLSSLDQNPPENYTLKYASGIERKRGRSEFTTNKLTRNEVTRWKASEVERSTSEKSEA